ncbi:glycosyl transferase family A [Phyllobacterium phragmitis]|uniref:Glycosyl transferase family A n=1 Tax=Phyllobacterium phragmitis TaxID=2670329 RepID=A0A2S9IPU7_9HYPH|nr:glycosyltransferase [Phyllobacterium phragmitis]PRD42544.1 glycosyl transferase family A [Phyllobacterium phragmitis]
MAAQSKRKTIANGSDVSVCVIIAAKNAAGTIGAAISSALGESHVTEVVVVDDGSTDGTSDAARAADDGSGRLRIIRFDTNKGPASARNHAISASSATLISILDADDFFIPGRFSRLLANKDWDLAADNIVFVDQQWLGGFNASAIERFSADPRFLDLPTFVEHNISRRNKQRGELGFLKPVIRRDFLDRHGLRYNEKLRLGEDYDLYTRALAVGARFQVINNCGYGAVVRADSLSGRHRTDDLKQLADADKALLESGALSGEGRKAVREHEHHIRGKYHHRQFLDTKSQQGFGAALAYCLKNPSAVAPIAHGVFTDKLDGFLKRDGKKTDTNRTPVALRYLFTGRAEAE